MALLNRTTRSIAPTEAWARLLERLGPALGEVEAAIDAPLRAFIDFIGTFDRGRGRTDDASALGFTKARV